MADLGFSAPDALSVESWTENGSCVIRLSGDLDMSGVGYARAVIEAALAGRPQRAVLDLSALAYMDSSGIALLAQVTQLAAELVIRNPTPAVRKLIELTGLSDILRITDDDHP